MQNSPLAGRYTAQPGPLGSGLGLLPAHKVAGLVIPEGLLPALRVSVVKTQTHLQVPGEGRAGGCSGPAQVWQSQQKSHRVSGAC